MHKEHLDKAIFILKTAKGQIESVIKMVDDDRYCIDISNQILAVQSLLKKANLMVLENHLNTCVKEAIENDDADNKTKEIMQIISRMTGK
ncbi:MAG: metal-sensing transcriptional repressor [Acholeplasmataceae bacterium]|nr:metal-sensing transcriptional repressor [Acholeplasmataceae bacterium]